MSRDNGGAAYPELLGSYEDRDGNTHYETSGGMTLRDYLAAHAPITMSDATKALFDNSASKTTVMDVIKTLAEMRIIYADAMLAERAK